MICLLASLLTVSTEAVTDAKPPSHTTMVVTSNACFPRLSRVVSGILLNSLVLRDDIRAGRVGSRALSCRLIRGAPVDNRHRSAPFQSFPVSAERPSGGGGQ